MLFAAAAPAPEWNVLLFTIDSCNQSRMSLYGNPVETTPNIDRWARHAAVFDRAYSVSAWTAPGLVSILSGMLPSVHGVDSRDRHAGEKLPTLLKAFGSRGFDVPNLNFFTFAPYYQNLGLPAIDRSYFTVNDGDELLNYLDRNAGKRFFVWYHTTKVHQPYNPPDDVLKLMMQSRDRKGAARQTGGAGKATQPPPSPVTWEQALKSPGIQAVRQGAIVPKGSVKFSRDDLPALHALYDAELYNMDQFFGRVLEKLREKGLEDRTLIVLTADHGEELLEHDFVGHASTSLNAKLFEELIHIPLVIRLPGQTQGTRNRQLVQQIDIAPTLLQLFGIQASPPPLSHSPNPPLSRSSAPPLSHSPTPRLSLSPSLRPSFSPSLPPSLSPTPPPSLSADLQGRSLRQFLPLVPASRPTRWRSHIFLESVVAGNQTTKEREDLWIRGIRTQRFKYIEEWRGSEITQRHLFDLLRDPQERRDLATARRRDGAHFEAQVRRITAAAVTERRQYSRTADPSPSQTMDPKDCPVVEMPEPNQTLQYNLHTGAMLFQWRGSPNAEYVIEYDIGTGEHHVAGQYDARGNYQILGPFPPELWISLKAWNPFKIRVANKGTQCWSDWRTFYF